MADESDKTVLSYAAPHDEVWTPPDSVHMVLGAFVYTLAMFALAALYARTTGWRHGMLPSAVLALLVAMAGTFLFLPSRWNWRRVMAGVLVAAGVAVLLAIGFHF